MKQTYFSVWGDVLKRYFGKAKRSRITQRTEACPFIISRMKQSPQQGAEHHTQFAFSVLPHLLPFVILKGNVHYTRTIIQHGERGEAW